MCSNVTTLESRDRGGNLGKEVDRMPVETSTTLQGER
jgi:hypothetical protein